MGNRYGLRVGRVLWVKRLCCIALEVSGGYSPSSAIVASDAPDHTARLPAVLYLYGCP